MFRSKESSKQAQEAATPGLSGSDGRRRSSLLSRRRSSVVKEADEDEKSFFVNDPEEEIELLEGDIKRLSERCAALEAQNVLVSVQVLDVTARAIAWMCSIGSTLVYCKCLFCFMNWFPSVIENQLHPALFDDLYFLFNPISWTVLKTMLCFVPYLYNRWSYGLVHRRFEVFAIAFIIMARIRLCRWRERMFMTEDRKYEEDGPSKYAEDMCHDAIWEANYEVSARFLYVSILRLKGLWTKSAQYLSSRADFMPVSYVRELKRLQDETSATEWKDIEQILPDNVLKELIDIDKTPLASASIGQVHTARLKSTGEKVALKVQHPHAETLITDDFWSLKVIARIVSWMEPEYEFFEILMREWATEAQKELDFTMEAANLEKAGASIAKLFPNKDSLVHTTRTETNPGETPFQVEIPRPIQHLTSRVVLVMNFCEGTRVDNFDELKEWGLKRDDVMDAVAQSFAHMMYCTDIFSGDPHPGNIMIRKGTTVSKDEGFTVVLLDWGLAKQLPEQKRIAFCQMAYAAATFDYGLLLDSFNTVGLKIKKENVAESMEGMRFFLRDMAPREKARKRIKARIKTDQNRMKEKPKGEKVPVESKSYPGEFFFFIRVNELLHGLGSKFNVEMAYLDLLRPYAERGLEKSALYAPSLMKQVKPTVSHDSILKTKLENVIHELDTEKKIAGAQLCVLDKDGQVLANVVGGHMGGLKKNIPMTEDALVLGYSCTKAIAATLAHVMVKEGYLTYDEPVCERVWPGFCPTEKPPRGLDQSLDMSWEEVQQAWSWKRSITLQHILTHQAGMWKALPAQMTIKSMASCEECVQAFEYNTEIPEDTLLPTKAPGEATEYHFMSFGWLVAGTLIGAYELRHGRNNVTFEEVYKVVLEPRLSRETKSLGFRPCGGSGDFPMAQTVTSDIRASRMLQMRRESQAMGEENGGGTLERMRAFKDLAKSFKGKEFLLDPRVWNCTEAQNANVPAAGGRFSASGLAHFYHDLGSGAVLDKETIESISAVSGMETSAAGNALQGATTMTNDSANGRTMLGRGYQLIRFDKDTNDPSGFGHAGVGGSIGFYHKPSGMAVGLMLNKADGGEAITMRIMRVFSDHFEI